MTQFERLLASLHAEKVDFSVIGGLAVIVAGHVRATTDLDICYDREKMNLERLARALAPLNPRLRGIDPALPFVWDARTLASGLNFTLSTSAGDIDLFGDVPGLGGFPSVRAKSRLVPMFGTDTFFLDVEGLILAKRAAGRPKDLLDLEALAAISLERPREG